MTTVVNIHHKVPYDVLIGRSRNGGMHWGNPFSHMRNSAASVIVDSREQAVDLFEKWLDGLVHQDVEPERRSWILQHLPELEGRVLGCYCAPKACHGHVYVKRLDRLKFIDINTL